jgi:hypothetical protein
LNSDVPTSVAQAFVACEKIGGGLSSLDAARDDPELCRPSTLLGATLSLPKGRRVVAQAFSLHHGRRGRVKTDAAADMI